MTIEFISTKEYKRFTEFCKACHKEKYIGLCYGQAGVGKSQSAHYYSEWDKISEDIKTSVPVLPGIKPSLNMESLNTIIYTPEVCNTPKSIKDDINGLMLLFDRLKEKFKYGIGVSFNERVKSHVEMLIVDEADRLQPKSLEQIRDLYDRYQFAVILIGMPGIEKRLVRFPQLYSRVGFSHEYKPLSEEEVIFIIKNHCKALEIEVNSSDFSDHETIAAVIRITHGNFRLMNRLLKQSIRIMKVNQLSSVSKEVVEAARECLVIGHVY
jgi:DNA transposition AAA+ family ATPase